MNTDEKLILDINNRMIKDKQYLPKDAGQMQKISSLKVFNDYDYYILVCALCNYDIPEKPQMIDLRMQYFLKINGHDVSEYNHSDSDYNDINPMDMTIRCINSGRVNKYGLYEYEINTTDKSIINSLWESKNNNCLKYVDNKTFDDKIVVSIRKEQLDNFKSVLNKLSIGFVDKDIEKNLVYNNDSENSLVDLGSLTLPFTPYDYQVKDAKKIVSMKRALLGHEMGCGKTFISILVGESIDTPKLVICPESLRLNWLREIKNVQPDSDVQILLSSDSFHFGQNWTITGYLTANKFIENLKQFDCIFVDEVQYCKAVNNWGKPTSKRAASVIDLANKATYCYLLSGTPVPSHNKDLFNILKMLRCPEFDFNNQWAFKAFADKFCDPKDTYFGKDYSGNSNSDKLHEILSNLMIRRLKKDVLPNLKKQRQFIPIAPTFKRDYKDIMKRLYKPNETDTYMGLAMTGRKLLSMYKYDTTVDLAESMVNAEESVVIVTNFVDTADKLVDHFKDDVCEIRGGMTDAAKQKAIDDFQSGKKHVCVLNMMAGGVGITLTSSHNMIIMDYAWLPADMIQVEDRICRSGQSKCCNIYYIYCENSILDKIFIDMISSKSENIDLVVDNISNTFDLSDTKEKASTYLDILKKKLKETKVA